MNTKTFLQEFEHLANVPDGIQKLRDLILALAVQGKLITLNANENASELMQQIKKEKQRFIYEGIVKKPIVVNSLSPSEEVFSIPETWVWAKLGSICSYLQRGISPKYSEEIEYPVISQKCIQWSGFDFEKARFVTKACAEKQSSERFLQQGDLLWNSTGTGTIGRINVFPGVKNYSKVLADSHVTVLRTILILPEYVYLWVRSPFVFPNIEDDASGTTKQVELSKTYAVNLPIPIPPIEDQKNIISKVNQLMELCNQLESQQKKKKELRDNTIASSLNALTTAETQEGTKQAWQRVKDHFELLYDTPDTVPQLRQAILQLAVQGKLVPQDPNDEPAETMKCRIKKNAHTKRKNELNITKAPFSLPLNWCWANFTELGEFGRGKSRHRPRNDKILYQGGTYPVVQTGDVARANGLIKTYTGLYNDVGLEQSRLWRKGTMCITIAANIADSGILSFDSCFPDSVVGFVPADELGDARYFEYFMRTAKSDLTKYAPSTAQKNINLGILSEVLIPLPPVREMKKIVTKVERLLAICDQHEKWLQQSQDDGKQLLEAMIHQLINEDPDKAETSVENELEALTESERQAASVAYLVAHWRKDQSLGDIKVTKTLYLLQEHLGIPLGLRFEKAVAGPFDKTLYSGIQKTGQEKQWFTVEDRGGKGHRYKLARKSQEGYELGKSIIQSKQADVDALMKLLAPLTSDDVEIITTLYGAWQELLEQDKHPTDEQILEGFYAWSEKKKQYPPEQVKQWLGWMRDYEIEPRVLMEV